MDKIAKINPLNPEKKIIKNAASILKKGGLVIMPTETVYGIGANALNARAVNKVFKVKNRSRKKPLIVLISKKSDIRKFVKNIPREANVLIKKFWPGPLTLVFKKKKSVPGILTGGKDTIAVRLDSHPVALALIRALGAPITAPSANPSGKPSENSIKNIIKTLGKKKEISLILDAGKTSGGISTILDLTKKPFKILRIGSIPKKSLNNSIKLFGILY